MPPSPLCPVQDKLTRASLDNLACVAQGDRLLWISIHFFSCLGSPFRFYLFLVQGNDMGPSIPAAAALVTMAIMRLSHSQRQ